MVEENSKITKTKLNLGAGTLLFDDFVNQDLIPLQGIDVAYDLNDKSWPLPENHFEEVFANDVLEHLSDPINFFENIWKHCTHEAKVNLKVPYWNSYLVAVDPTHKRGYHELSFEFLDPTSSIGKLRDYYSKSEFRLRKVEALWFPAYSILGRLGVPIFVAQNRLLIRLLGMLGWTLELRVTLNVFKTDE